MRGAAEHNFFPQYGEVLVGVMLTGKGKKSSRERKCKLLREEKGNG